MSFLLLTHDHAHRPRLSIHTTGKFNNLDERRKVKLIPVKPEFQQLRLDELQLLMSAEIEAAITEGIAAGRLVAPLGALVTT